MLSWCGGRGETPRGRGEARAASSLLMMRLRSWPEGGPLILCTLLRELGLGPRGGAWASDSLRTESATVTLLVCPSSSSSLCSRWGGGGGRNSMLPRGVVLLLGAGGSGSSGPLGGGGVRSCWLLLGGGGLLSCWLQLRRRILPRELAMPGGGGGYSKGWV